MVLDIDIAIVIGFLLLNLIVGFGYGKEIKTIKEYALGGRNFSIGALVATIVATWASGSAFFITLSKTYTDGWSYALASIGEGIYFIVLALFLVPRMGEFLGKVSIAEAMGELYGKKVRVITAIAGTIGSAGLIAVQFKVFGNMFSYFLHLPGYVAVIAAGTITTMYSAFGGIRAVTFTDILQFFTFGVVIPLVGFIIWSQFYHGGFSLEQSLLDPKFNISHVLNINNPQFFGTLAMFLYFSMPTLSAPAFQRIAIGRSIEQVRNAFLIAGIFLILIKILIAWIPFLLYSINPSIAPDNLLGFIIDQYSFTGLKGLIIIAVIAFAMSTADSRINSAAVLFTNDICKVFSSKPHNEIVVSRLFAFALGIGSILLALFETDILGIIVFANSFYYPIITSPFLLTVLGFRSTEKSVLIGIAAGFITNILWKTGVIVNPVFALLPKGLAKISQEMISVLLAMVVNAAFLMGSHYLLKQKGGWVGVKDTTYIEQQKAKRKRRMAEIWNSLVNFDINKFLNKIAPTNNITYVMLGIYFIICTFTTMYSTQIELLGNNSKIILVIYQIMMITGAVIAMYPIWPLSISQQTRERAIKIIWPIATFYMLIFFSTFFVMVSNFALLQVAVFVINLMIVALFFGWRLSIVAISIGFYLGIVFYRSYFVYCDNHYSLGSPEFVLVYIVVLVATTLIVFLKPKQDYIEVTESKVGNLEGEVGNLSNKITDLNEVVMYYSERVADQQAEIERLGATAQKILNNVNHELRLPVGNVKNFAEMLSEELSKYDQEYLKMLSDEVVKNSTRLSSMILNMLDLATLDVKKIELKKQMVNLSELVEDRVNNCRKIYLQGKHIDFEMTIESNILANIDANYIRQAIDNLVINAITYTQEGTIKISVLRKGTNMVEVIIKDDGIGIPKTEIYDIFTPFKMSSKTESKAEGRGIGLALCKSVVEAHGGTITAESDGIKGATFKVILNLN